MISGNVIDGLLIPLAGSAKKSLLYKMIFTKRWRDYQADKLRFDKGEKHMVIFGFGAMCAILHTSSRAMHFLHLKCAGHERHIRIYEGLCGMATGDRYGS